MKQDEPSILGLPTDYTPHISDAELLRRAVQNAGCRGRKGTVERWVTVKATFLLGSDYSKALCQRFGFNPNERVKA